MVCIGLSVGFGVFLLIVFVCCYLVYVAKWGYYTKILEENYERAKEYYFHEWKTEKFNGDKIRLDIPCPPKDDDCDHCCMRARNFHTLYTKLQSEVTEVSDKYPVTSEQQNKTIIV
jgi:Ca2+/Na+ antiporter